MIERSIWQDQDLEELEDEEQVVAWYQGYSHGFWLRLAASAPPQNMVVHGLLEPARPWWRRLLRWYSPTSGDGRQ